MTHLSRCVCMCGCTPDDQREAGTTFSSPDILFVLTRHNKETIKIAHEAQMLSPSRVSSHRNWDPSVTLIQVSNSSPHLCKHKMSILLRNMLHPSVSHFKINNCPNSDVLWKNLLFLPNRFFFSLRLKQPFFFFTTLSLLENEIKELKTERWSHQGFVHFKRRLSTSAVQQNAATLCNWEAPQCWQWVDYGWIFISEWTVIVSRVTPGQLMYLKNICTCIHA